MALEENAQIGNTMYKPRDAASRSVAQSMKYVCGTHAVATRVNVTRNSEGRKQTMTDTKTLARCDIPPQAPPGANKDPT